MHFENHLKAEYSVTGPSGRLVITRTSCYSLGEETLWLVENLPLSGTEHEYCHRLASLGLDDPRRIFDRLVNLGVLNTREDLPPLKKVLRAVRWLFAPDVKLIPSQVQARLCSFLGIEPANIAIRRMLYPTLTTATLGLLGILAVTTLGPERLGLYTLSTRPQPSVVFALILLGTLLHELGHSFAAAVNGIGFRPIGFSVYLFYPVFYTNVSGVEKLDLRGKLAVDFGGIIPQAAYFLLLFSVALYTHEPSCTEAVRWISWMVVFNLNPLLRTDGYWVYNDLRDDIRHSYSYWMRGLHYIYLTAFAAFTAYLLWRAWMGFGVMSHRVADLMYAPSSHYGDAYKIVLGLYCVIMTVLGGVRRLKETQKEWMALRSPARRQRTEAPQRALSAT